MPLDRATNGKIALVASGAPVITIPVPFDRLQALFVWGAASDATDTVLTEVSPDGSSFVPLETSARTGAAVSSQVLDTAIKGATYRFTYVKGAGAGLTIFLDALQDRVDQQKSGTYKTLAAAGGNLG